MNAPVLENRPGVRGATMITHSGLYFDFLDPDPNTIMPRDIAWGLSNCCRFNGHTTSFYSVAQHCVLASWIVEPGFEFEALLHDASEAYTGDMISPLKQLCPDFKAVERRIEFAIAKRFKLWPEMNPAVKHADLRMLRTEQRDVTLSAGDNWNGLSAYEPMAEPIIPWAPEQAYREWLGRFGELCGGWMP